MRVLSGFVGCAGCLESDEYSAVPRGRGQELEAGSWLAGARPSLASSGPWASSAFLSHPRARAPSLPALVDGVTLGHPIHSRSQLPLL